MVSFSIIPTLPFIALVIATKPSRRAENCMVGQIRPMEPFTTLVITGITTTYSCISLGLTLPYRLTHKLLI